MDNNISLFLTLTLTVFLTLITCCCVTSAIYYYHDINPWRPWHYTV